VDREIIFKAGLAKVSDESKGKEPYDVFRDRIIFPLSDQNDRIIAFSGRALSKETEPARPPEGTQSGAGGPKYLNSPDTILFAKSEVLYGLDKAKEQIRRKDYAVLVEGQMDLVLSHQARVENSVAASGTAFTRAHLERLRRFSSRVILAFDGDAAGEKAAERASHLGISLGLEVKVANLPEGQDPAEVASRDPQAWRDILRDSKPAVEFFFHKVSEREKDERKLGKEIVKRILPLIKLMESAIEQSHFIAMIARRTGIREEVLWEDLKKVNKAAVPAESPHPNLTGENSESNEKKKAPPFSQREQIEERLAEIGHWRKELIDTGPEALDLESEESELRDNLANILLRDDLSLLRSRLAQAELSNDKELSQSLTLEIQELHNQMRALEQKKKMS
jgi:DNA primase